MQMSGKLNIVWILLFASFLFSCKDEVDYGIGEYRVDWVKVQSSQTFSMLNRGETLLVGDRSLGNVAVGNRILLNYTRLSEREGGYDVRINGGSSVFCDTVMQKSAVTERLGNDSIRLESVWIGACYLNVSCYVDLYGKGPVVALVLDRIVGNTYYLSFFYDKRNDPAGSRTKVNCSFDLSKVAGMPADDKKIVVTFNGEGNKSFEFNY